MNESEVVGLLFVVVLLGLVIGSVLAFSSSNKKDNDLSDVLKGCEEADSHKKTECVLTYRLEHYALQFELIGELWYPSIKTGDHISRIDELDGHARFRNILLETLLYLKVKQENQLA